MYVYSIGLCMLKKKPLFCSMYFSLNLKSLFDIMVVVTFQSVFRLEMHRNNIIFLFLKFYF